MTLAKTQNEESEKTSLTFALIGNQNCGKTTLFNLLTGAHRHVGNFPGVTVDTKIGAVRTAENLNIVDLPGVYSLHPYSAEERLSLDYLLNGKPDGIINIVDATCLSRGLFLTLQLLCFGIPTVVALNMIDEVRKSGGSIDTSALSRFLGVPVVAISAGKAEGIEALIKEICRAASDGARPTPPDFHNGDISRLISAVRRITDEYSRRLDLPCEFCALSAIEGDEYILSRLKLDDVSLDAVLRETARTVGDGDIYSELVSERYAFIERAVSRCSQIPKFSPAKRRSAKIDRLLTNRYLSIPIFLLIITAIFHLTFDVIGSGLQSVFELLISFLTDGVKNLLLTLGVNDAVTSLVTDGILGGVGSVLSFLPVILVLFFFLSLLEDSGYMARVAFIFDGIFRKIGLSGKAFVPMLIGFGCSVPAIMATRTLPTERERKAAVTLVPYISCSAKIPIYAVFASAFFERGRTLIIFELYIIGILLGLTSALILKKICPPENDGGFIMELPDYRMPSAHSVAVLIFEKAKDFITRAFTVILLSSVAVWFLSCFGAGMSLANDPSQSLLSLAGNAVAPLLRPLGFEKSELAAALIVGLTAKEAVVSTLGVLTSGAGIVTLFQNRLAAFSFLLFTLLYTPCIAAFAAAKSEFGSYRRALLWAFAQCAVAYFVSFLFYNIVSLII